MRGGKGRAQVTQQRQEHRNAAQAVQDVAQLAGAAQLRALQHGGRSPLATAACIHVACAVQHAARRRLHGMALLKATPPQTSAAMTRVALALQGWLAWAL